jgi:hypothetical protein
MTGRDEFVRQHPDLAVQLDRVGRRAVIVQAYRDVHATGQIDTDLIYGGLPVTAGFGVLVTGMTAWSWSPWLILPTILLGTGVVVSVGESVKCLVQFAARVAARSAWLHTPSPDRTDGDPR